MNGFQVRNNELIVGGMLVSQLAAKVGSTPFYAYDKVMITSQLAGLKQAMPAEIAIYYAIKANPMKDLVAHVVTLVDGLDVSSQKEMGIALGVGVKSNNISFSGPGKRDEEIAAAVEACVTINIESMRELNAVIAFGKKLSKAPRVAVRVNPDFSLKGLKIKMGGATQFGVDVTQVGAVLAHIKSAKLDFEGFHIFSGSQNLKADLIINMFQASLELAFRLADESHMRLKSIKIGGGFGVPYFPGDEPLDIVAVGKGLKALVADAKKRMPSVRLIMELGRYIVSGAGVYICRIIDRKVNGGQVFLIVDGGMNHHLAASGHFGQVIRKNYPVAIANRMSEKAIETVSIVGPLCTTLDLLADKVVLPKADIGDYVVIFQSGAYGFTASPLDFISHPHPKEVLV